MGFEIYCRNRSLPFTDHSLILSLILSHRPSLHLAARWNPYGRAAGWDACSSAQPRCPHPSRHLLVPLQSAAALPTGQFRWSAVSCHRGPPTLATSEGQRDSLRDLWFSTLYHAALLCWTEGLANSHPRVGFLVYCCVLWSIQKSSQMNGKKFRGQNVSRTHGRLTRIWLSSVCRAVVAKTKQNR